MARRTQKLPRSMRRHRLALTLTELLMAMAISLVFMGSVVTAFIQISRASDETEAKVQAHTRARTAVDSISRDLRRLATDPFLFDQEFFLVNNPLSFGNNVDDDEDGVADEDNIDGFDTDGDWTAADDQHAAITGTRNERPDYVGVADVGDRSLDEDHPFSHDELTFRIPANGALGQPRTEVITYRVETFDGIDHVLVREVTLDPGLPTEETTIEPIVFDVVSLDIMVWNANNDVVSPAPAQRPYWQSSWDSTTIQFPDQRPIGAPFGVPPFEFPACAYVSVTVNAERLPLTEIHDWPIGTRELRTETLSTTVTLDVTTKSVIYELFVRPLS